MADNDAAALSALRGAALQMRSAIPVKLAHIVLATSQFAEMVAWYKSVLNAKATFENEMLAFLTYDDEHHRIAIANVPGLADRVPGTAGIEHFAFTYRSLDDLLATYVRLTEAGIDPVWTINHGPTMSFYYQDPDSNRVELQIDSFQTAEEVDAFIRGDFVNNPIGVEFDPKDLIRRFIAGENFETLLRRPEIGIRTSPEPLPPPA